VWFVVVGFSEAVEVVVSWVVEFTARAPVAGSASSWPTCNAIVSSLLGNLLITWRDRRYSKYNIYMFKLFQKEYRVNSVRRLVSANPKIRPSYTVVRIAILAAFFGVLDILKRPDASLLK
jgi:hypothetical protein